MPRINLVGPITITLCILLASCTGESDTSAVPMAQESRFIAATERFGNLILSRDFAAAHGMFANSLRETTTPEQLAQIITTSEVEYHEFGPPVRVEGFLNASGDEIDAEGYDIPESVPTSPAWTAYTLAEMVIEQDDEGEAERCYDIGLLWVREDGTDRIAHLEYFWCD